MLFTYVEILVYDIKDTLTFVQIKGEWDFGRALLIFHRKTRAFGKKILYIEYIVYVFNV